ncbi:hypothetical protein E3N88_06234 [Mikania micrantha]|uniref:LIM zinc-binding domain-containing protein n=1 Tax=Mikania micrantha TaxID=192012 RepID=A0A5N6PN82_9ASTR|nr:hypothetical protein E3N88_06234 [Mikania micrantha]
MKKPRLEEYPFEDEERIEGSLATSIPSTESFIAGITLISSSREPAAWKKVLKPNQNASKLSSFFEGTRDKCVGCTKIVYPIERVKVDGAAYHRSCFKCCHGGCTISPSNYIAHEGRLYCKHHHIQLFKKKGNYSQLEVEEAVASPESSTQNSSV